MSAARRPPSLAPQIEGFDPRGLIGSGGFADVFRYQQLYPRREVAVKVLVKDHLAAASIEILAEQVPVLGRVDVSSACEEVLRHAMAKDPTARPQSAIEFARALQRVQISLALPPTTIPMVEEELLPRLMVISIRRDCVRR